MPSARRIRLLTLSVIATVVFFIYYTSSSSSAASAGNFYERTVNAIHPHGQNVMNSRTGQAGGHIPADRDADGDIDEDDAKSKQKLVDDLGKAQQVAQEKANQKAPVKPDNPSHLVGVGNSREGQKKDSSEGVAKAPPPKEEVKKVAETELKPEEMAHVELVAFLKKSPGMLHKRRCIKREANFVVVIFSKSYCPYSKRAKGILLDKYTIDPKPFVVELDEHPIGSALQDLLLEKTGRRTVPNILVNGVSIGGSDQIVDLDEHDKLAAKIQELGERKVSVSKTLVPEQMHGADPK